MKIYLALLLCVFSIASNAQDERYYRSIFTGELFDTKVKPFTHKIEVESAHYMIDLNRDGKSDSLQAVKKDGVDFIRINDEYGRLVFESKLDTKGKASKIFRVSFKAISPDTDVLILHFYEGENDAAIFESSARLYFLTIPKRKLKEISFSKGPFFWSEKERAAGKYWARRYSVSTIDFNKDGIREISVSFNKINRIYFYLSTGQWRGVK
jgi:hypothetical protein